MNFSCAVSKLDSFCEATLTFDGPLFNPFEELMDDLSIKMLLGLTREHKWSGENGNRLTLVL